MDKDLKYLGLPLLVTGTRKLMFQEVVGPVQKRLQGWKGKLLSQALRGTLIKSVAQALPSYVMSSFVLPKSVRKKIDGIICKFWWGVEEGQSRGLYLKAWSSICLPKSNRRLGFRQMCYINRALIAMLGWAMTVNEDRLWVKILKTKYLRHEQFLSHNAKNGSSWIWQGIIKCKDLVVKGACFSIGDVLGIDIWEEPLMHWLENFIPTMLKSCTDPPTFVNDLFGPSRNAWDMEVLHDTFVQESVEAILKVRIPTNRAVNKLFWVPYCKGSFSVNTTYLTQIKARLSVGANVDSELWKALWRLHIHERHKFFLWKVAWNIIPTRKFLVVRFDVEDLSCSLYGCGEDTLNHLFLSCSVMRILWHNSNWSELGFVGFHGDPLMVENSSYPVYRS